MRVLGVDPGSRYLGYGLAEWRDNRAFHVASGVIKADATAPLHIRLAIIFRQLRAVIEAHKPEAVAVEGVFTHKNARSALILGHARGVALLLAAQAGLEVFEYAPAKVKRSVGTGGNDSKESVARMVERWLSLKEPLERADAYDALAVALCHLHYARVPQGLRIAQPTPASARRNMSDGFQARLRPALVRP